MPPAPYRPPEPSTLHQAFAASRPLDWGGTSLSAADLARRHGAKASRKSLRLLKDAVAVEPRITAEFLASLPPAASPYQLVRRVKSPESLARKIRDWQGSNARRPIDDLLRYTVLTESPDDLVAAAVQTADALTERGWQVAYAMHSYTDGSRYKGIHAYLRTPDISRIEVQWHSIASVRIKELTTQWYEIDRSAHATDDERTAARQKCVEASAQLRPPDGIDDLTELGGKRVAVNNYSDSRRTAATERRPDPARPGTAAQHTRPTTALDRTDGIAR
ncbi:hypothetical protein ACXC9Q_34155 [Kribbella sp. CWNU-51]